LEKEFLPQRRHRSREIALQLLYSIDLRHDQKAEEAFRLFPLDAEEQVVVDFARELLFGVLDNEREIDNLILRNIVGWRPERMVAVDRAAVRLALFEGVVARTTPLAVAISEAVELAKSFGTEDSGRFVNGVLGRIVRALEPRTETTDGEDASKPDR
jgi:N utilization substance protein B